MTRLANDVGIVLGHHLPRRSIRLAPSLRRTGSGARGDMIASLIGRRIPFASLSSDVLLIG